MDNKYVVFKKSEFKEWMEEWPEVGDPDGPESIQDAVVIRRQDVFAPPALDAYANAIQVAIQIAGQGSSIDGASVTKLQDIADYFHEQAQIAWDTKRKLPD